MGEDWHTVFITTKMASVLKILNWPERGFLLYSDLSKCEIKCACSKCKVYVQGKLKFLESFSTFVWVTGQGFMFSTDIAISTHCMCNRNDTFKKVKII